MARTCEVCARLSSEADSPSAGAKKLRRVRLERRVVALCDEHAAAVRALGAESLDALRALFVERSGRRSFVDRRSPLDRRVFPPRPEGRRHGGGRRGDDRS
jgi:hypothetical protein